MDLGDRYASLLRSIVREEPLLTVPRQYTEHELQAHWFAGDFGRDFTTLAGDAVHIVQFGVWNRESGPDFVEAAVSINGSEPMRGSIELDPDARDWEHHAHASNPAYENVVLHLFMQTGGGEFFTRTVEHRNVPQVLLDVSELRGDTPQSLPTATLGRCAGHLRELPDDKARAVLLAAARHRMNRKATALARLEELHGADEALFQSLAITLGYKSNKLPFTLLAQRLPLKLLRKVEADALLFGVSGFLPSDITDLDPVTRKYVRDLWERWWSKRGEYERLKIPAGLWQMSGQRPMNHPQRRLAALAQIVRHWPKIRTLRDRGEVLSVQEFFAGLEDEYWEHHYTVTSKASARPMALVGESRVLEMLANVFFPWAIRRDEAAWAAFVKLRSPLANQRAEVAAMRLFGESKRARDYLKFAPLQQGLLQIYEDFCLRDASDCAHCRFPEQLLDW